MRKFDDIGTGHRSSVGTTGDETYRRNGLDVASQEKRTDPMRRDFVDGRADVADLRGVQWVLRGMYSHHDGCIVVTSRPESSRWPEHLADCIAKDDSIPHCDRLDAGAVTMRSTQHFGHGE